jgi:hypothetical protein
MNEAAVMEKIQELAKTVIRLEQRIEDLARTQDTSRSGKRCSLAHPMGEG